MVVDVVVGSVVVVAAVVTTVEFVLLTAVLIT